MSFLALNVCGMPYAYPNVGQNPFGVEHIQWAEAVSSCLTQVYNVTGANLGSGQGIYANKSLQTLNFKSLIAGAGTLITSTATEITITSLSSVYNFQNVGTGNQVYDSSSVLPNVNFRSLTAGSGIQITTYPLAGNIEFQNLGLLSLSNIGTNSLISSGGQNPTLKGLLAGANITITPIGNDLEIASTGSGITTGNLTGSTDIGVMNGTNAVVGTGTGLFLNLSGVTTGTYGSSTQVPVIAVDAKGRITSASNVPIPGVTASFVRESITLSDTGTAPYTSLWFSGTVNLNNISTFNSASLGSPMYGFNFVDTFTYTGSKNFIKISAKDGMKIAPQQFAAYGSIDRVSSLFSNEAYHILIVPQLIVLKNGSAFRTFAPVATFEIINPLAINPSLPSVAHFQSLFKDELCRMPVTNGDVIQTDFSATAVFYKNGLPANNMSATLQLDNLCFVTEDF